MKFSFDIEASMEYIFPNSTTIEYDNMLLYSIYSLAVDRWWWQQPEKNRHKCKGKLNEASKMFHGDRYLVIKL